MLRNKNLGVSLADSVNILAAKYSVTKRALYKDWKQRKHWLPIFLHIEDPHLFFLDLLSTHKELLAS